MSKKKIFFSHADEDKLLAKSFYDIFHKSLGGTINYFISSVSINSGKSWFDETHKALDDSDCIIVLFTPNSRKKTWVNYEFGYAKSRANQNPEDTTIFCISLGPNNSDPHAANCLTQSDSIDSIEDLYSVTLKICKALDGDPEEEVHLKNCTELYEQIKAFQVDTYQTDNELYESFGVKAMYPGLLKRCSPKVLRSIEEAKDSIVIAAPSISTPLSQNNSNGLRVPISEALQRGVNVSVFLINPTISKSQLDPDSNLPHPERSKMLLKFLYERFKKSNTCLALTALTEIKREISKTQHQYKPAGELKVFLVDKATLDFAIMCDGHTILCRSTIHWSPEAEDQQQLARYESHDFKPPIIEAIDRGEQSFFREYKSYLQNMMFSAGLSKEKPESPNLATKLFHIHDMSDALTDDADPK